MGDMEHLLSQVKDIQVDQEDLFLLGVFLDDLLPLGDDTYQEVADSLVEGGLLDAEQDDMRPLLGSQPAPLLYNTSALGRVVFRREALRKRGETLFRHVSEELNVYFPERSRETFDQVCLALAVLEDSSDVLELEERLSVLERKRQTRWASIPEFKKR